MVALAMMVAVLYSVPSTQDRGQGGVESLLQEEAPDVFLAKATLQQYLSRLVRKDWDGAKRLTHPKTLAAIGQLKKRSGAELHNLAPWANKNVQLKTFRFTGAREIAPGIVAVQVGEDTYRAEEQGMSVDDAAVYLLFKSRGGFLVGDKKAGADLSEVSANSVKAGYPGYVDQQVQIQARRESSLHAGHHR